MNDFLGQVLAKDDYVVGIETGYKNLVIFRILAFTPKMVRVKDINSKHDDTTIRWSGELIKLDPELVTMKILKERN